MCGSKVIVASHLGGPSRCITNPGCVGVEDGVGYWVLGLTPGARGTLRGGRPEASLLGCSMSPFPSFQNRSALGVLLVGVLML